MRLGKGMLRWRFRCRGLRVQVPLLHKDTRYQEKLRGNNVPQESGSPILKRLLVLTRRAETVKKLTPSPLKGGGVSLP